MEKTYPRRPAVAFDARGGVETHGHQKPLRGIVHDTESGDAPGITDLEGVVNYWREQDRGLGAHLIIDKDGHSALCANPNEITYAVAGYNTGSFHVELVGYASFTTRLWFLRLKQLRELAKWMAWLNVEYNVPLIADPDHGWSGHRDQPQQIHTDPGKFFPKGFVLRLARKYRREGWN